MNVLQPSSSSNIPHYFPPPHYAPNGRMAPYTPPPRAPVSPKRRTTEAVNDWVNDQMKEDRRPLEPPSPSTPNKLRAASRRSRLPGGVNEKKRFAGGERDGRAGVLSPRMRVVNVPLIPWWKATHQQQTTDLKGPLYDIIEDSDEPEGWKESNVLHVEPLIIEVKAPQPRYAHEFNSSTIPIDTPPLSPDHSSSSSSPSSSLPPSPSLPDSSAPSPTSSPRRRHRRRLSDLDDIPELEEL